MHKPVEAALREQLAELEREMSLQEHALAREADAVSLWEERALASIDQGDGGMARAALVAQTRHLDKGKEIEADLMVLRELRDVCRLALSRLPS